MNTRRLIGFVFLAFLLFQCTEEPPADLYQGTPADSSAIKQLVAGIDTLMTSPTIFAEDAKLSDPSIFGPFYWEDTVTGSAFWIDDTLAFGTQAIRVKTHPYQFGRVITDVTCDTTLLFGIDTTCVVYLDYSFKGNLLYQVDSLCSLWYRLDTLKDLDSFKFDAVDMEITKDIQGTSHQAFFFDLDEDGEWKWMKVSGMMEYQPTTDSAISTVWLVIKTASKTDSIFYKRPDPTKPENAGKYGMNQLIPNDSLVSVFANEDVSFEFRSYHKIPFAADTFYCRIYATIDNTRLPDSLVLRRVFTVGNDRYVYGTMNWMFTEPGRKYITLEFLDAKVGYYSGLADEESYGHYSTIWRVPIEVK